jgi:dynein light intermediate chain
MSKNQRKKGKTQKSSKTSIPSSEYQNTSNNPPPELVSSGESLIRFDTPFLVSATISNKKLLAELDDRNELSELFLQNIINGINISDYSLKDALNKILPPKKLKTGDQMWVQYVSCNPVTKAEVINLYDGLREHLKNENARLYGLCPIRERLYDETFYELIRQITINCLERGILLMRIKTEADMTINTYQTLYESSISYGMRMFLIGEQQKKNYRERISKLEDECEALSKYINDMEKLLKEKKEKDEKEHNKILEEHEHFVKDYRRMNNFLKSDIEDRLSFHN